MCACTFSGEHVESLGTRSHFRGLSYSGDMGLASSKFSLYINLQHCFQLSVVLSKFIVPIYYRGRNHLWFVLHINHMDVVRIDAQSSTEEILYV